MEFMSNEIRTKNFEAKDIFNAATAMPLKTMIGQTLPVVALWITERPDADGVVQTVANFKTEDGSIYGTISETIIRSAIALPEMLGSMPVVNVKIEERAGTKGRSYLVMQLV